jgi:RNA polymerase sigma factor (sigma-70 family)
MAVRSVARGATIDEIKQVYERRLTQLRRLAEAIVGEREQALDVVQEAFARAVRQRASFAARGSVDAWVWRIVVNSARDHVAARGHLDSEPAPDEPREEVGDSVEHVRAVIAELPERQRLVLFLRYYADLDYRSIGEVLAISTGTVGATLNAAHARMRKLLEEVA